MADVGIFPEFWEAYWRGPSSMVYTELRAAESGIQPPDGSHL